VFAVAVVGALAACVPTKPPAPPAFDRMVDEDGQAALGNCDATDGAHATIAAAITAAAVDDVIGVCPGTYTEQVTIPNDKDGIALVATQSRQSTIKAPATMAEPGHLVHINGPTDVAITGFVIAGPLPDALFCSPGSPRFGVFVGGGASATIDDNHITEIRASDPALRSCTTGVGIRVGRAVTPETGTATITSNDFDTYQRAAIVVDNTGSGATITDNTITGDGPIDHIVQGGIEIFSGATATIERNHISNHNFTPVTNFAAGIFLLEPGVVTLRENVVDANDENVTAFAVSDSLFQNNVLTNAKLLDGIFFGMASSGNTVVGNIAQGNATFDCQDESTGAGTGGTANTWVFNLGASSSPPEVCTGLPATMTSAAEAPARPDPSRTP
jgi:hypothetical protein